MNFHGFTREQWEKAKQEATHILVEKAKAQATIPYSELVTSIKLFPVSESGTHRDRGLRES